MNILFITIIIIYIPDKIKQLQESKKVKVTLKFDICNKK